MSQITFDDFQKVDLRTAKIISAEGIAGSEKLVKLRVLVGDEERQIVAGIKKSYAPDNLVGKTIVIVANLEPRSLLGNVSDGMVLAVKNDDGVALIVPDKELSISGGRIT